MMQGQIGNEEQVKRLTLLGYAFELPEKTENMQTDSGQKPGKKLSFDLSYKIVTQSA